GTEQDRAAVLKHRPTAGTLCLHGPAVVLGPVLHQRRRPADRRRLCRHDDGLSGARGRGGAAARGGLPQPPGTHCPGGPLARSYGGGVPRALAAARALRGWLRSHGLRAGLIVAFLRDESEESAMATLDAALALDAAFIGVGLDS